MTMPHTTSTATHASLSVGRRIADATTMFFVSLVSILLLVFIADGTIKRTYEQLLIDKSAAQGELVRNSIEAYVRPGLPLRQFTSFNQQTSSIISGDKTLTSMFVELPDGELAYSAGDTAVRRLPPSAKVQSIHNDGEVRRSDSVIQIILPLKNKFERVGYLILNMDRQAIYSDVSSQTGSNLLVGLALCAAFGMSVFSSSRDRAGGNKRIIALTFTACFAIVAIAVILSMISLFTAGAESKGRALASSLGQRFDDIPQLGLQLDQIEGLDDVLDNYRNLNPEISSITITVNGRIAVHTDRSRIGALWASASEQSEYRATLTPPNHPRTALVILSVPRNYVLWQVARNIKNYAALFVASALFAALFLQVAHAIQTARPADSAPSTDWRSDLALELVKPVFFLAVFVDHLSYAFLPQFMTALQSSTQDNIVGAAWPFTAYYLCFALALIPAGHYSARIGSRNLVVAGLAMVAVGLACMAFVQTLGAATLARAIGGLGQGLLFIGVQSHIFANARRENRTRSNSIVVYGFQAGMISGMAIGSLLVGEIAATGVFIVGACIAVLAVLYTYALMPADKIVSDPATAAETGELSMLSALRITFNTLRDPQFTQAILLIGIPAKAILTGVILFGMPLLLSGGGFAKEDIGQITMIYAACVMLSSAAASRLADKMQTCRTMLVSGALLTAAGLAVITLVTHNQPELGANAHLSKALLFAFGAALIGCAHGLINAPVVTYITETAIAARAGEASTAASYRFLERCGHMLGPIIVGQLFAVFGTTPQALTWLAISMVLLAAIFQLFNHTEVKSGKGEFA
jgi:predicted MFS family arabinose efflux permease